MGERMCHWVKNPISSVSLWWVDLWGLGGGAVGEGLGGGWGAGGGLCMVGLEGGAVYGARWPDPALSGVAGHTLPSTLTSFNALQCIDITRTAFN